MPSGLRACVVGGEAGPEAGGVWGAAAGCPPLCESNPPHHLAAFAAGDASHAEALLAYAPALTILQLKYPGKWNDLHFALPGVSFAEIEKMAPARVAELLHEMRVASGWWHRRARGRRRPERRCGLPAPLRIQPTPPPR